MRARGLVFVCAKGNLLKHNARGSREPQWIDPDFAEALSGHRESNRRQAARKTSQFCRQVQRALNLALADRAAVLGAELFVEEVTPAPDCGRLLVHVLVPNASITEALALLGRETPRLRAEVAAAITRKRAPELCFLPVQAEMPEGGFDD